MIHQLAYSCSSRAGYSFENVRQLISLNGDRKYFFEIGVDLCISAICIPIPDLCLLTREALALMIAMDMAV